MSSVSLDNLHDSFYRLQINTVLNLLINGIACYFVLHHSTPQMHHYKYYILMTVLSCAIMDFHISFVFGFYMIVQFFGVCSIGLARFFGNYGGPMTQYCLLRFTVCFVGISLVMSIMYRYYSLVGRLEVFHSRKMVLIWILLVVLYPLPSVLAALYGRVFVTWEDQLEYVKDTAPRYYDLFRTANCNAYIHDFDKMLDTGVALVLIAVMVSIGGVYVVLIVKQLKKVEQSLSKTTYKMQKQFFVSLCFQIAIPSVFLVIPLFILFGTSSATISEDDATAFTQYAIQIMALHGSVHGVSVLYFYPPYRRVIVRKLEILLRLKSTAMPPHTVMSNIPRSSIQSTTIYHR